MRRYAPSVVVLVVLLAAAAPSALADGEFEPNDIAVAAAGPLTGQPVQAGIETAMDVDWYRFYAKGGRQVQIAATLAAPCASGESVRFDFVDAEPKLGVNVPATMTLGQQTSGQLTFTSRTGRRYFVKVTHSGCVGARYSVQVTPADALLAKLQPQPLCTQGKLRVKRQRHRVVAVRGEVRRAHGKVRDQLKRRLFREQIRLRLEKVKLLTKCSRRVLVGNPFMH